MAYKLNDVLGFGDGRLGNVSNPTTQINSYANVTVIGAFTVTIGTASTGTVPFAVGQQVLLHVSATTGTDASYLGKMLVATITSISGSVLTLDKDPSGAPPATAPALMTNTTLATHHVQAITIAQYNTLTISSVQISPPAYSATSKYGGVLAIKCKSGLVISDSGSIYLVDKGIPTANSALRPLTSQETEMKTTGQTAGWENHITARQLLLNVGNGAVAIWAKIINNTGTLTRIGGTAAGAQYYPYTVGDNNPAEVLGGSSILLVAETITGWTPTIISKAKGTGAGYGRCYIATETLLPPDEGLYAQDCISKPGRLTAIGIKDFGDGSTGDVTNPTTQINSYAAVTAISGKEITIGATSIGAYGGFDFNSQIIVHLSAKKTTGDNSMFGKFYKTKIIGVSGSVLTVADAPPWEVPLSDYYVQAITVPQFNNFTLSTSYSKTLAWNNTSKIGGICIVQTKKLLDLSGGSIAMTGKGLPNDAQRPFIAMQGNVQQKDSLPISQGNGAVLLLFDEIKGTLTTRIGGTVDGAKYGGKGGPGYASSAGGAGGGVFGGLPGASSDFDVSNGGMLGGVGGGYGSGGRGCIGNAGTVNTPPGGFGCNNVNNAALGGTSIFMIGNKVTNFSISWLSTGGSPGTGTYGDWTTGGFGEAGGCSYGGGGGGGYGGWSGTGGSGAGTSFLCVNEFVNPSWTGVAI